MTRDIFSRFYRDTCRCLCFGFVCDAAKSWRFYRFQGAENAEEIRKKDKVIKKCSIGFCGRFCIIMIGKLLRKWSGFL